MTVLDAAPAGHRSPGRHWARLVASPYGGTARMLARGGGAAVAAVALAELHAKDDPGVLCPLRRLTGVPCPVCGSTTVFMDLGAGHVGAAITANPVTVLVGLALLVAPLRRGAVGAWWWRLPVRRKNALIALAAGVSWLWQLHRFGFLPS